MNRVRVIVGYGIWLAATFVLSQLLVVGLVRLLDFLGVQLTDYINANVAVVILNVVMYGFMLVMTVGIPARVLRQPTTRQELGLSRGINWKDIALTFAGMISYFVLTAVLLMIAAQILPWFELEQAQDIGIVAPQAGLEIALVFVLLVLVGPTIEEVLFRGYLFGKLRTRGVPFWLTMLVVSVLFGIAHMQWNVGIDTFALSLVMCVSREVTGALWPSILMHMAKNGIAFYFLFVNPQILQGITG